MCTPDCVCFCLLFVWRISYRKECEKMSIYIDWLIIRRTCTQWVDILKREEVLMSIRHNKIHDSQNMNTKWQWFYYSEYIHCNYIYTTQSNIIFYKGFQIPGISDFYLLPSLNFFFNFSSLFTLSKRKIYNDPPCQFMIPIF